MIGDDSMLAHFIEAELAMTFKHKCDVFWETFPDPGIGKAKQANAPMAGDIGRLFAKSVYFNSCFVARAHHRPCNHFYNYAPFCSFMMCHMCKVQGLSIPCDQ